MKNIGLLTFHYPINYGALLQTYATVKKLEGLNNNVTIINYYSEDQIGHYDFYKKPQSIKNLAYYAVKSLFYNSFIRKKRKFRKFLNSNCVLSEYYNNVKDIDFSPYDIIVTGSDQVFNLSKRDRLPYFQPFKKNNGQIKASYAPSFGISNFDSETLQLIGRYVKDFDFISCREDNGARLLSELIGKPVKNVLDPVFLLNSEEWSNISSKRLYEEKYIFIYDLNGKEKLVEIAKKVKEKHGFKIVMVSNDSMAPIRRYYKDVDIIIKDAGIEEFISLIKYASILITDSFHGTAFSIIFRKDFYSYIALEKASTRIESLLKNFEILNRLVKKEDVNGLIIEPVIYNENIILKKIDDSKEYLMDIIS